MKRENHKLRSEEYGVWFSDFLGNQRDYQEALKIVRNNSQGNIWLIGSSVPRAILFGDWNQSKDFDFIVEGVVDEDGFYLPANYGYRRSRFGGLKLISSGNENIDLIVLKDVFHIKERKVKPTIENYLSGVPFNIHALAWDVADGKLIGNAGIRALQERVVRVNDLGMAENMAKMYGVSVRYLLEKKAGEFDFSFDCEGAD